MSGFSTETDGAVLVATMDEGENRIGTRSLDQWNRVIDTIDTTPDVGALVVVGTGKYWSTGLDLDEVSAMGPAARRTFMRRLDLLLGRLLTAPVITVAALNGHTYAGGALLAIAFDYRVMRRDRGYFCLPSVDVGIPFSPGMSALISTKLPKPIAHDLVVSCREIGAEEAAAAGVVTASVDEGDVLPAAMQIASSYAGKDRTTLTVVKRRMYPEATSMLTTEV